MRPHNSGHWSIEGSRTSQFEQHLRAVLDYPLGSTEMLAPVAVMANVLGGAASAPDWSGPGLDERVHHLMAHWPDVKLHWYGKGQRPGRKLGHVTALGDDAAAVRARAVGAARYLADAEGIEHE
jgi:5-(carboxyamino)imidazole ribonucleotide synthase